VILGSFWTFTLAVEWIEMSMGIRFISRWIAYGLLLLGFLAWWLADRGIPRWLRWFALAVVVGGATIASFVADKTVVGFPLVMSACPYLLTAWAAWIWLSCCFKNFPPRVVRVGLCAVVAVGFGFYDLVRWDGLDGGQHTRLSWRWTPTAEQRFLATRAEKPHASRAPEDPALSTVTVSQGDWPQFRGPNRDSRVTGARIRTDWLAHPPQPAWRKPVGPGWSSMAIVGRRLFTQEQRGDSEAVVCYDADSGAELWVHEDRGRFDEALSGAGPRATPTFANGRIYTLGAMGRLNCLDAATGQVLWTRNAAEDANATPAQWGFSASPLVSGGVVAVFVGGENGLLAYRADSGKPAWTAATGKVSHSSPHAGGEPGDPQVDMITEAGLVAVDTTDGSPRWQHPMPGGGLTLPIAQPQPIADTSTMLIPWGPGIALVELASSGNGTAVHERWTSNHLKPSLNDFVVCDQTIYGFDDGIFCAVDLETGKRRWKKGRYGHGQVLLFADQRVLLVTGEQGEVVLLAANPDRHEELARFQAIEGKTWNHPAFAHGRLHVRNAKEMACYDLAGDTDTQGRNMLNQNEDTPPSAILRE
jgi:outer membrane protein assembly factor BamB